MLSCLLVIVCESKFGYEQVLYFSLIGGATIKDFVSRTMNKLLHPDFAKRFVWAGRLTKKHAFKHLELRNVLFGMLAHFHLRFNIVIDVTINRKQIGASKV